MCQGPRVPTALELVLASERPVHETADRLHGLACALLEGEGADHTAGAKPFTVWPLRSTAPGRSGLPAQLLLRLNWLPDTPVPANHQRRPELRLGGTTLQILRRHERAVPYAALAAAPASSRVVLRFHTATYFSRNGRDFPLPDPILVFQSLARRWNAHCPEPLRIEAELTDRLLSELVVSAAQVETTAHAAAHRQERVGFVGQVEFALLRGTGDTRATLAALAASAPYLGVGAQTTRGFGVVTPS